MISGIFRCNGGKKADMPFAPSPVAKAWLAALALTMLSACSSGSSDADLETAQFEGSGYGAMGIELVDGPDTRRFIGSVVADEPRAALAGRTVLENGGNAVDAITAMYFTLAVTMPHEAGLGGGGICLVHDPKSLEVTSYDFLPRRSLAGGPVALPGNVRGFALIQAVHGKAPWASLVAPAEVMAAKGHEISRALARDLEPLSSAIRTLPQLASIYLKPNGEPLREGDKLVQTGLAASLGQVRANGPREFYSGNMAENFAQEAGRLGSAVAIEELRAYRPNSQPAQAIKVGDQTLSLPAANTGAGTYLASLWPEAQGKSGAELLRAAEATLARAGAETSLPPVFGSAGFVVATARGDAAACAVTMNGPFGTGRLVPGTGVVMARAPDVPGFGLAGAFLSPVLVTNEFNGTFFLAASGGGGPAASASVLHLAEGVAGKSQALEAAQVGMVSDARSLVNAVACPQGAPREDAICSFSADPNGAGLGVVGIPQGR